MKAALILFTIVMVGWPGLGCKKSADDSITPNSSFYLSRRDIRELKKNARSGDMEARRKLYLFYRFWDENHEEAEAWNPDRKH